MTIKVLLICENPDENARKMWGATYDSTRNPGGVTVYWGRIASGYDKSVDGIITHAAQSQRQAVADDDAAVKFIDKKVKEKSKKGYSMVTYDHDGIPMTFLCDNQPDEHGRIKMRTWGGTE